MMCSWMFAPLVCFYSWRAVIDRENVFSWVVLAIVYLLSLFAFRELVKNPAKQLFLVRDLVSHSILPIISTVLIFIGIHFGDKALVAANIYTCIVALMLFVLSIHEWRARRNQQ